MKDIVDFIKGFDLHNIIIIGLAFWWLNGSLNTLDSRLTVIEKDVAVIKAVMSCKGIISTLYIF